MKEWLKTHKFTLITMVVILIILLMPVPDMSDEPGLELFAEFSSIPHMDKLIHLSMFGFLSCVCWMEGNYQKNRSEKPQIDLGILIFYGILTEVLQKITGYRTFDVVDISADVVGIFCGYSFLTILRKYCKFGQKGGE